MTSEGDIEIVTEKFVKSFKMGIFCLSSHFFVSFHFGVDNSYALVLKIFSNFKGLNNKVAHLEWR